jgi:hypothetical protein
MTGRFSFSSKAPVHILILRQSSLCGGVPGGANACQHKAPKFVAFRTPSQGSGRFGDAQRSSPIGGAVYGMPLNARTPLASRGDPVMAPVLNVILGPTSSRSRRAGAQEMVLKRAASNMGIEDRMFYCSKSKIMTEVSQDCHPSRLKY